MRYEIGKNKTWAETNERDGEREGEAENDRKRELERERIKWRKREGKYT